MSINTTKIPQARVNGLVETLTNHGTRITDLEVNKANVVDLTHLPTNLVHYIEGKTLKISPGHVLNYSGNEVFTTTGVTSIAISTVTAGLRDKIILGDTAERIDIIDYTSLSAEFSSQGRIIPVDSLGSYDAFASGTQLSRTTDFDNAVAMFYEGTENSLETGFLFDEAKEQGEYVVTLAADEPIADARIAFYSLTDSEEQQDGKMLYTFTLVSQSVVASPSANVKVSLTAIAPAQFNMIAVAMNNLPVRYCRMYKVSTAATYNTFLCKTGSGFVIRMALTENAIAAGGYSNFAKVGQVTIGNGPIACYPEKDIASYFADGDMRQQEPSYSNFYTRKEMDQQIAALDRAKPDWGHTLAHYGINDAYTQTQIGNLLSGKQNVLTPGTNIQIATNPNTGALEISTTFDETYSKAQADAKFAQKGTTLSDYGITNAYTKTEVNTAVSEKQNANDDALQTTAKSIVPAINEIFAIASSDLAEVVLALPQVGDPKKIYFVLNANSESVLDSYSEYIYVKEDNDSYKWEMIGGGSSGGSGSAKADNITIISNVDESVTTVAVKTKSNVIKYDWIGTTAQWKAGRENGTILDEWFCYIIDDGTPVVDSDDTNTYATIEYVDDLVSQEVDPVQAELTAYKSTTDATLSTLSGTDTALEQRVSTLETLFGSTVDEINGEVI